MMTFCRFFFFVTRVTWFRKKKTVDDVFRVHLLFNTPKKKRKSGNSQRALVKSQFDYAIIEDTVCENGTREDRTHLLTGTKSVLISTKRWQTK